MLARSETWAFGKMINGRPVLPTYEENPPILYWAPLPIPDRYPRDMNQAMNTQNPHPAMRIPSPPPECSEETSLGDPASMRRAQSRIHVLREGIGLACRKLASCFHIPVSSFQANV